MKSIQASVVAHNDVDSSYCQLSHNVAISKERGNPKCIDTALILDINVDSWVHQHHLHHLQVALCNSAEEWILWKFLLVNLTEI